MTDVINTMDRVRALQGRHKINPNVIEGFPATQEPEPDFEPLPEALEVTQEISPLILQAQKPQEVSVAPIAPKPMSEPDLLVMDDKAVYRGRGAVLSESARSQIARIVLRESIKGAKAELDEVEKLVPRRARRVPEVKQKRKRRVRAEGNDGAEAGAAGSGA